MHRGIQLIVALLAVSGMAVLVTWPQALHMSGQVASHFDPYFSMWRLNWIAHALSSDPANLFDGNVFYPARRTLAMSDATLLEGLAGTPLLWAGVSPVLVYNLLLLGGMVGSGLAMFVLTRSLTRATGPAIVAAVIFAVAPYRVDHFMHLELQWAMWIPLTLWAVHRALEDNSWKHGLLAGVFLWLQTLSAVYYGVFLAMALAVFVPVVLLGILKRWPVRGAAGLLGGAALSALLVLPYAMFYRRAAETLGNRDMAEISRYSAHPISYLASPPQSWLWGWTSRWGTEELYLFPGAVAIGLAILALLLRPGRLVLAYVVLFVAAFELSLGANGAVYSFLLEHVDALHGLRATARFGIVALCATAVLAALGMQALQTRFLRGRGSLTAFAVVVLGLLALDYRTSEMYLVNVAPDPPPERNVYTAIRSLGPGVVYEAPAAKLNSLPGYDPWYAYWSRLHWNPLINGYSGYYPREFVDAANRTARFPDDRSIEFLKAMDVRYVVVHRRHFEEDEDFVSTVLELSRRPELKRFGSLRAPHGEAELFVFVD